MTRVSRRADTAEGLAKALAAAAAKGTTEQKRALIEAHPDLAGKLALAKTLTADSTREQASAGLDRLTPDELRQFSELNDAYRDEVRLSLHHGGQRQEAQPTFSPPSAPSRQRRRCRDDDRARRDRPDCRAQAQGHPALSAKARIIRGRVLSFTDDPAESGSRAYSLIDDGAVLVAGGLIEAVGRGARHSRARAGKARSSTITPAASSPRRLHRRPRPLSADPGDRLLRRAAARLAYQLHLLSKSKKFADPAHCARVALLSSSTSCFARAPRPRWSIAPCILSSSTRSSPRPKREARA